MVFMIGSYKLVPKSCVGKKVLISKLDSPIGMRYAEMT